MRPRRGIALAAVLAALVVTAALAAALHFAAAQAARAAGHGVAGERALAAAELALADAPALWAAAAAAPAVAESIDRAYALAGGDYAALRLTRVTGVTAWASAVGTSGGGRGRARRGASLLLAVVPGPDGASVLVPVTRRAWSHTY